MKIRTTLPLLLSTLLLVQSSACGVSPITKASGSSQEEAPDAGKLESYILAFPGRSLSVSLTWIRQPAAGEGGVMDLKFWDSDRADGEGPYLDPPGTPHVELWMPEHGHGSSPVTLTAARDSRGRVLRGQFVASDISFSMQGNWEIRVQLKNGNKVFGEAVLPYVSP